MVGRLRLIKSNGREAVLQIKKNQVLTVGRSSQCSVRINDILLSRKHFRLWENGGKYFIEDLQSKNGTYVDGKKNNGVEKLKSPARIEMGATKIEFSIEELDEVKEQASKKPKVQLLFCEECDGSIPAAQLEKGLAQKIDGRLLCKDCAQELISEQIKAEAAAAREEELKAEQTVVAEKAPEQQPQEEALEPIEVPEAVEEVFEAEEIDEEIPTEMVNDEQTEAEPAETPALEEEEEEVYDFSDLDTEAAPAVKKDEAPVEDSGPIDVIDFPLEGGGEAKPDEDVEDSGPIDLIDFQDEPENQ